MPDQTAQLTVSELVFSNGYPRDSPGMQFVSALLKHMVESFRANKSHTTT